jgi:hypothetical protein
MPYYAESGRSRPPNRLTLRITLLLLLLFCQGVHAHRQNTHKYIHLKISFCFSYAGHWQLQHSLYPL